MQRDFFAHGPQGVPWPPWPPLGLRKVLYFTAFFASTIVPMVPKGPLCHLGRPWGREKTRILRFFSPPQWRPCAPKGPLATVVALGVAKIFVFYGIFRYPSGAHGPPGAPWPPWSPLGRRKTSYFTSVCATPVAPMGPNGHLWAPRCPLGKRCRWGRGKVPTLAFPGILHVKHVCLGRVVSE